MSDDIDTFELLDFIIARLRENQPIIQFNGHHHMSTDAVRLAESPMHKWEVEIGQDYMTDRTDKYFADWYNIQLLVKAKVITQTIVDAWKNSEITEWVPVAREDCAECGESVFSYFNGLMFMFATADAMRDKKDHDDKVLHCRFAGGIKEYRVKVFVNSGRLVFANDFRSMMEDIPDHYVNYSIGIHDTVVDTAKQGFLTAFVGNSCPTVFQSEDGTITVGNEGYDDDDKVVDPIDGVDKGSICTDLWWFYAVDGDTYNAFDGDYKSEIEVELEVEPGCYEMTVYPRYNGKYDGERSERYVTIKRLY